MPNPIRFTQTVGDATAVVALLPQGDRELYFVLTVNQQVTDTDTARFDSSEERDEALARTVGEYTAAGYTRL